MPCTNHPLADAGLSECWICGRTFCGDCLAELQGRRMCAPCKAEAVSRLEQGEGAATAEGEKAPWERIDELGVVGAYVKTVTGVMGAPGAFFERLDTTVTTYACLFVPVITQTIVALAGWVVSLALFGAASAAAGNENPLAALVGGGLGFVQVILAPIFAVIGAFLGAASTHLVLVIGKNARHPYHQTFRGLCYSSSVGIVGVVPFVGPLVGGIWGIVTQIIMVMKVHRVSGGVAALAVLALPLVLGCCAAIFVIVGVGVMSASR